jgi:hypothetical protein
MEEVVIAGQEPYAVPRLGAEAALYITRHETTRYCYLYHEEMACYVEAPPLSRDYA